MQPEEIIDKLRPTLRQEGLEVDFLGRDNQVVNIRARRVSPGVPVAFLIKAIAGTFKRYLPEVQDVCLMEYDPGEGIDLAPSDTFAPVFQHRPAVSQLQVAGLPVADLSGLDRRDAVKAIEGFLKVWAPRSPVVAICGLEQEAPLRAARKWAEVYRDTYQELTEVSPDRWEIVLDSDSPTKIVEVKSKGDEIMPGRIFLTSEDTKL